MVLIHLDTDVGGDPDDACCRPDENGRHCTVVSTVDGDAFAEAWLSAVEAADSAAPAAGR